MPLPRHSFGSGGMTSYDCARQGTSNRLVLNHNWPLLSLNGGTDSLNLASRHPHRPVLCNLLRQSDVDESLPAGGQSRKPLLFYCVLIISTLMSLVLRLFLLLPVGQAAVVKMKLSSSWTSRAWVWMIARYLLRNSPSWRRLGVVGSKTFSSGNSRAVESPYLSSEVN